MLNIAVGSYGASVVAGLTGHVQCMPRKVWTLLVPVLMSAFASPASAQTAAEPFPTRPIHIIVPFPAGSTNSTHGANPGLIAKMPNDPVRDFVPIGLVGFFSSFLVVNPALPINTPAELIAYGKANPKALSFAAGNTSSLIMGEMFARGAGIEMPQVPYTGNPPGITDVIAGRVQVMFPDISSSIAHVKSGLLRAIAVVTLGERSPLAPELPTVSETVLPNFNFIGWVGLFAPAGTPAPVIAKLAAELQKVVAAPEVGQRLQQLGAESKWMGPAEFRTYVVSEVARLPKILADIGVQAQ